MIKDFDSWGILKKKLDNSAKTSFFKEREVWWCSISINVGDEENGKNQFFSRPFLIVRKFNKNLFLGVSLATKIKENKYYHRIHFKACEQRAMLSQLKIFEGKRIRSKMGGSQTLNLMRSEEFLQRLCWEISQPLVRRGVSG